MSRPRYGYRSYKRSHPATKRRRRLCERSGHRWGWWMLYFFSSFPLLGGGIAKSERGQQRWCSRCEERQYREVEMEERDVPPALIVWSEPEHRDDWQADPDAWKGQP